MNDRALVETIRLDDDHRLVVYCDEGAECPRGSWHTLTGFVKLRGYGDPRRMDVPAVHEDPIDLAAAHQYFDSSLKADPREVVPRWARIFHGMHVEYDSEHGGYWFVAGADAATRATPIDPGNRALFYDNWPDLPHGSLEALAKQKELIEQDRETYRQWADGEVYGVALERRRRWVRADKDGGDENGDERFEWEEEESIWGNYLDEKYTALDVAREHFDITLAE